MLGDLVGAEELWARSVELFRALEGTEDRIPGPTNVAEMLTTDAVGGLGVRIVFEETLQPFVEIDCVSAVGYVLANQAGIVRARGDHERARALLDDADACFARAADDRGRADVLVRRAYLELAGGSTDAARSHLEHALEERRRLNDRRGVGLCLQGLGLIATIAEEYPAADDYLAEARDLFRRAGDRWGLAATLWRTADLAFARHDVDGAEAALHETLDVLHAARRQRWIALTLAGLAEAAVLRGDDARADDLLADAEARFEAKRDAAGVAAVAARRRRLAQATQRSRKGRAATPSPTHRTKGRRR
jgi:tetratricopeptide (TPR) repeat protein